MQEVGARTQAAIELLDQTFARAARDDDRAVAVMLQADMFDPTVPNPSYADYSAFTPIVRSLAAHAAAFDGPVYLFNGDSHLYNVDRPLAIGSPWLSFYGVTSPTENLTRITVDGSTGVDDYLRVRAVNGDPRVLEWERVPFTD